MKIQFLFVLLSLCFGQNKTEKAIELYSIDQYVKPSYNLSIDSALELASRISKATSTKNKNISIALLDASGTTVLLLRGNGVGPHSTEASRRKAYTASSTKTLALLLLRNSEKNPDTKNLNSLPELLLLSGSTPTEIIGSVVVSGGESPENDDWIAQSASIPEIGITTTKSFNLK